MGGKGLLCRGISRPGGQVSLASAWASLPPPLGEPNSLSYPATQGRGKRENPNRLNTFSAPLPFFFCEKEYPRKLGTAFPIFSSPCLCQKCGRAGRRDDRSWERRQSFLSDRRRLLAKSALGRETRKSDAAERRVSFRKNATYNFIFYVKVYTF